MLTNTMYKESLHILGDGASGCASGDIGKYLLKKLFKI